MICICVSLAALGLVSLAGCEVQNPSHLKTEAETIRVFQPAANMRSRSLFREDLSIRRRFPDLEMSHQDRLPAESQAPRQHLLSVQSQTWTTSFGGCTFSGDYAGAPLVRTGSCPTVSGYLYLDGKGITSVQPDTFQGMSQMTALHLENNQLSALPPGIFAGLSSLGQLYLSNNQLSALPPDIFAGLPLQELWLSNNQLQCAPISAQQWSRLTFNIRGPYQGPVTCASIPWTVAFGGCTFSGDYAGAPLVRTGSCPTQGGTLDLSLKGITLVEPDVFQGMPQMTQILLSMNQLSALPTGVFAGLSPTSGIDLSNNQLSVLPPGVFAGVSSLWGISLSNNQLTVLPSGVFAGLSSLSWLYMSNNKLSALPPSIFAGLSSLQSLVLSNNQLSALPPDIFAGLPLQLLWLAGNQLSTLPPGVFSGLSSLWSLDLDRNELLCTLAGSGALTTCTCNAGSSGPNFNCTACVAGKYKASTGSAICSDCRAGTYSTGVGASASSTCIACPSNSTSPVGSAALTNCSSLQTPACAAGKYKSAADKGVCTDCPTNSASPAGSTNLTNCTCNAGFSGADGGPCTACVAGKYKALTGSAVCTDCGAGTYSTAVGASASSTCIACPSNSTSSAGSSGVQISVWNFPNAMQGQFPSFDFGTQSFTGIGAAIVNKETFDMTYTDQSWMQVGAPADNFAALLTGTLEVKVAGLYDFWTESDDGSKLWIDSGLVVDNGGLHEIVKIKGTVSLTCGFHSILVQFFEGGGGAYLKISYSGADTGGVEKPVVPSSAPPGSVTACTCNAGFSGPDGGPCTACVAGKYKTLTGTATCTDCGAGTYSAAAGASESSKCSACPSNSWSPAGSTALTNCTCNAGWTGPDAYLQFRLVPVVFRDNGPALCCHQVSEFRFFDMQESQITPTSATNPGGSNPGGEEPGKMIDEDITTKFLDFSKLPAEFQFSSQVVLGSYEWVTGNDFPERDMLSWRLEGRQTAAGAWTTLQSISNYPTTQNRKQIVGRFNIPCAACLAGKYSTSPTGSSALTSTVLLWSTRNIVGQFGLESVTGGGAWGAFMNEHAVWPQSGAMNFEVTTTIYVPSTSVYELKGNCDNRGTFYVDGNLVMTVEGFSTPTSTQIALTVGQHTLRIVGEDQGVMAGIAFSVNGYPTTCTTCPTGKYKESAGSVLCSDCPPNSASPAGSTNLTNCTCNAGFSGADGGPCTACVAGKYKASTGSAVCSDGSADPLANILSLNPAYLIASAENWDSSQNRFMDPSGNGRVGTLRAGAVSVGSVTGNGATWPIPYVGGTTGTQISWGAASIPSTFTICSIARYSGAAKARILQCRDSNWLHGHHGNKAGGTYYGISIGNNPGTLNTNYVSPNTNWVVACGRNIQTTGSAGTIINGVVTSVAAGGYGNCELTINKESAASAEPSDWELSKVYVWNTHLPDAVFADASARLNSYLAGAATISSTPQPVSTTSTPLPLPATTRIPSTTPMDWGNASFAQCRLQYSLQQLLERESAGLMPRHRTGGLGLKMQPDLFEVWVCVDQHECAPVDGWFCWVIDESIALPKERAPEQYVAWGPNSLLKLFGAGP